VTVTATTIIPIFLPAIYAAGLLPALITAAADKLMERVIPGSFRLVIIGLVGYFASYSLALFMLFGRSGIPKPSLSPLTRIIGLVPALICSWFYSIVRGGNAKSKDNLHSRWSNFEHAFNVIAITISAACFLILTLQLVVPLFSRALRQTPFVSKYVL